MRLFLDDLRDAPPDFTVARSTVEALQLVQTQWPVFMSLDHDLGGDDTTMVFLRRLVNEIWDGTQPIPEYVVHSANPVGRLNIISFMESWKKSHTN